MMRWTMLMVMLMAGCEDSLTDACRLADVPTACPACADGPSSCELDGISTNFADDCGACFSRIELIAELCAAGSTVTEEEIYDVSVCQ